MNFPPIAIFLAGLVIVIIGAELLLRGASRFASLIGLKPIIIGLTIVSIGTSMPELAVGIAAVSDGRSGIAVGNIAGTNIVNILLILGLSAAIRRLPLELLSIKLDVPVMIAAALVLIFMAWDGILTRTEGIILVVGAIVYTITLIRLSKHETPQKRKEYEEEFSKEALFTKKRTGLAAINVTILIVGIVLTIWGADLLVKGAVSIAEKFGISDAVIGLTIVAIGTSVPELVTTVVATIKDDRDVAVGNLVGSSISNILVILGITCIVAPNGVDVSRDVLWFDLPLAAAVAIVCYPVFRSDRMVSRTEGALFVLLYAVYLATLIYFRT